METPNSLYQKESVIIYKELSVALLKKALMTNFTSGTIIICCFLRQAGGSVPLDLIQFIENDQDRQNK